MKNQSIEQKMEQDARSEARINLIRNCRGDIHKSWIKSLERLERNKDDNDYAMATNVGTLRSMGVSDFELSDYRTRARAHEQDILSKQKPFGDRRALPFKLETRPESGEIHLKMEDKKDA